MMIFSIEYFCDYTSIFCINIDFFSVNTQLSTLSFIGIRGVGSGRINSSWEQENNIKYSIANIAYRIVFLFILMIYVSYSLDFYFRLYIVRYR